METQAETRGDFTRRLKKFFKDRFKLSVRVTTGTSKSPYTCAWLTPDRGTTTFRELRYSNVFSEDLRRRSLAAIYGPDSALAQQTSAGNVSNASIAMKKSEWDKVLASYTDEPAAV